MQIRIIIQAVIIHMIQWMIKMIRRTTIMTIWMNMMIMAMQKMTGMIIWMKKIDKNERIIKNMS